jgi:hypothetical protein
MPFDENLMLCDGSADWTYANLVSSNYGTPTSTTRNDGGFAVLDMGVANIGCDLRGLAIVLILSEAANASDDALTVIIEESGAVAFGSDVHELGKFDIAAATKGIILGSECPATVIMRVSMKERYLRIDASCTSSDDFGVVYCYVSPYPYLKL